VFINLTPFIPLSLKGEGEEILERGFTPLKHPLGDSGNIFWDKPKMKRGRRAGIDSKERGAGG